MDSYATRAGGVVGITPRELGNTTYQDLSVTDGHKRASPALLDMSGALWDGVRLSLSLSLSLSLCPAAVATPPLSLLSMLSSTHGLISARCSGCGTEQRAALALRGHLLTHLNCSVLGECACSHGRGLLRRG